MEKYNSIKIQKINGASYTVVVHSDAEISGLEGREIKNKTGVIELINNINYGQCVLVSSALPALKRYVTLDDMPLIYRYMAEGIYINYVSSRYPEFENQKIFSTKDDNLIEELCCTVKIKGAQDFDGNKIEIAIEGEDLPFDKLS